MASATSGSFIAWSKAGSAADVYSLTLAYSYEHINNDNKTMLTISGTIKSHDYNYSSYNTSSANTVEVRADSANGALLYSNNPTTAYDCRNMGSTQIFNATIEIPHDERGERSVYIYWSFDGKQASWNPAGAVSGTIELPQSNLGMLHIKKDGAFVKGQVWINDKGTWKKGVPWVKAGGVWKKGGA